MHVDGQAPRRRARPCVKTARPIGDAGHGADAQATGLRGDRQERCQPATFSASPGEFDGRAWALGSPDRDSLYLLVIGCGATFVNSLKQLADVEHVDIPESAHLVPHTPSYDHSTEGGP